MSIEVADASGASPARSAEQADSLSVVGRPHASVSRLFGPGLIVAVGYMDPGNWATDIEAGARFGYGLLFVVVLASLAAMLLQTLAMRLGIVSGRDLAQLSREHYRGRAGTALGILALGAIVATNVAEVLGAALAFKLLFGFPLAVGILVTGLDTFLILNLKGRGVPSISAIIIALVATIAACFAIELLMVKPDPASIAKGLWPSTDLLAEPAAVYIGIGILGATVMPHNLYLHSALMPGKGKASATRIKAGTADTVVSLSLAAFINASILIVAASIFHGTGAMGASIEQAHELLAPLTGSGTASILFAVALLAAGHSSTFTGSIAGQAILSGFFEERRAVWQQRFLTRGLAILCALAGVILLGEGSAGNLLILSQVVLSIQLPFAIYPLIRFVGSKRYMGELTASRPIIAVAWLVFAVICLANLHLLTSSLR